MLALLSSLIIARTPVPTNLEAREYFVGRYNSVGQCVSNVEDWYRQSRLDKIWGLSFYRYSKPNCWAIAYYRKN